MAHRRWVIALTMCLSFFGLNVAPALAQQLSPNPIHLPTGANSSSVGTWDSVSRVFTLTTNVDQTIVFDQNYVTLDGAGFTATIASGSGLYIDKSDITVRNLTATSSFITVEARSTTNLTLENNSFASNHPICSLINGGSGVSIVNNDFGGCGINIANQINSLITGNTLALNNRSGIEVRGGRNPVISDNNITGSTAGIFVSGSINVQVQNGNNLFRKAEISNNDIKGSIGIWINGGNFWTITGNAVEGNPSYLNGRLHVGLRLSSISYSTATLNTINNAETGADITGNNNEVYNNNFINSLYYNIRNSGNTIFSKNPPTGGNFYSNWTSPDANGDGFVDRVYNFPGGRDFYPLAREIGGDSPNQTPVADAGTDQQITCAPASGASVALDGSASSDADDDALSYSWRIGGSEVATGSNPTLSLAPGTHAIELVVNDGTVDSAPDQVVVTIVADTTPPVVSLNGGDVSVEAVSGTYEEAGATANDICSGALGMSITGAVDSNVVGEYTITYTATDNVGNVGSATRTVSVVDTTPPTIASTVESTSLWPPNHKMHLVVSDISAEDLVDGAVAPSISVSIDDSGNGDGDTEVDFEIVENNDGGFSVYVRAERSGNGDGRTYTIVIDASDAANNDAETQTITVAVDHDQSSAADSGNGKGKGKGKLAAMPTTYSLNAAMPNPFNPSTVLSYQLPEAGEVSLVIYNMMGQQVRLLEWGFRAPGVHEIEWNGRDDNGVVVSSGVYLYRFVSAGLVETHAMTLLK